MSSASASGGTSAAGGRRTAPSRARDVEHARVEPEALADHDLRAGIVDLVLHLVAGERGVDGRRRGAQAPGGEQRDDELEPVRQGDRDDVAGADTEARQPRRRRGRRGRRRPQLSSWTASSAIAGAPGAAAARASGRAAAEGSRVVSGTDMRSLLGFGVERLNVGRARPPAMVCTDKLARVCGRAHNAAHGHPRARRTAMSASGRMPEQVGDGALRG
jgi:hypothetical protein